MPHVIRHPIDTGRTAELVSRALAHIDAHLEDALDADTLADRAAMSRHHFHRMFRAHVGCSVGTYVTWRRLQRACALLASGGEPVLEIALAVGYESAQALAKALRRELDTTPTAVRAGDSAPWKSLLIPERLPFPSTLHAHHTRHTHRSHQENDTMQVTRHTVLPEGIAAITATARGMVGSTMTRAAQAAFGELAGTLARAGLMPQVASVIAIAPDDACGPDDPHCRFIAGMVFGYDMFRHEGECHRPEIALSGTLNWQALAAGPYAVFTHIGPYTGLHKTWRAIYADWLPASGRHLRDAPPMELCLNNPQTAPPEKLHTEIWIPLLP